MFENLLYIDFSYTLNEVRFSNKKWGCENTKRADSGFAKLPARFLFKIKKLILLPNCQS